MSISIMTKTETVQDLDGAIQAAINTLFNAPFRTIDVSGRVLGFFPDGYTVSRAIPAAGGQAVVHVVCHKNGVPVSDRNPVVAFRCEKYEEGWSAANVYPRLPAPYGQSGR